MFTKKITVLAAVLLLAMSAVAAPGRRGFHPVHWMKHHKILLITSAAFVASGIADTVTSIGVQRRCPTCVETNDAYGPHPSAARFWVEGSAIDAAYVWFDWFGNREDDEMGTETWTAKEKQRHPKLYRLVWFERPVTLGIIGAATVAHARAAYHNSDIR